MSDQTYITLNDGNKIPQFGLGVYMIEGDDATEQACLRALGLGYRHIDTAHAYQNECGVGAALKKSGLPREDVWITSKLWPSEYGEGATLEGVKKMIGRLGTGYVDLLLLHQQFGDYLGAWRDMERAVEMGLVRSIGLSNFESDRLEEVLGAACIKPAALQMELHPYYQQRELKERVAPYDTVLESWYPIGHGDAGLINEPVFSELAEKYGKTNVQVILRWHIQEGNVLFPKTTNPRHMAENFDVFGFELTDKEMSRIRALDKGERFFNMTLEEQEANLNRFVPAD